MRYCRSRMIDSPADGKQNEWNDVALSFVLTCLSLSPSNNISSMSVNLGCLLLSTLSLISLGSNAIMCPFSPEAYDVSGL